MTIFIFLLVLCVINIEAAVEGDSCIKKGYPGVCTAIKQCPDALLDIENRVKPEICGFGFTTLVVCCISSGQAASQPATTTAAPVTTTDKPQKGNCILPPYPDHGSYVASVPNGKPGDAFDVFIITVSCRRGYDVQGSRTVVCQDGSWPEPMPRCLRACYLEAHPSVEYTCMATEGGTNVSRICREWESHGVIASPRCAHHYRSTTALKPMTCISGSWDYLVTCEPECGVLASKNELIASGTVAEYGEVPWHAGIYRKTLQPYQLICGGSLVSSNRIISAAHCFWNELTLSIAPASDYIIAVGKLYRGFDNPNDQSQWSDVEAIRVPTRFQGPATNFQDDIAILELSAVIQYRANVRPVCIDFDDTFESRQLQPGNLGKVAGWGLTTEESNPSQKLRTAELPYISIKTCYSRLPASFTMFITSDKICAGYENASIAVCRGDSGGGFAFPDWDKGALRYYLRGIVSTAPTNDNACNTNTYTTFTKLTTHEAFITLYWRD